MIQTPETEYLLKVREKLQNDVLQMESLIMSQDSYVYKLFNDFLNKHPFYEIPEETSAHFGVFSLTDFSIVLQNKTFEVTGNGSRMLDNKEGLFFTTISKENLEFLDKTNVKQYFENRLKIKFYTKAEAKDILAKEYNKVLNLLAKRYADIIEQVQDETKKEGVV